MDKPQAQAPAQMPASAGSSPDLMALFELLPPQIQQQLANSDMSPEQMLAMIEQVLGSENGQPMPQGAPA